MTGQTVGWLTNGVTIQSAGPLLTIADINWEIVGS